MSLHSSRAINRILQDSEMFPVPYVKACFSALLSVIVAASCTWILPRVKRFKRFKRVIEVIAPESLSISQSSQVSTCAKEVSLDDRIKLLRSDLTKSYTTLISTWGGSLREQDIAERALRHLLELERDHAHQKIMLEFMYTNMVRSTDSLVALQAEVASPDVFTEENVDQRVHAALAEAIKKHMETVRTITERKSPSEQQSQASFLPPPPPRRSATVQSVSERVPAPIRREQMQDTRVHYNDMPESLMGVQRTRSSTRVKLEFKSNEAPRTHTVTAPKPESGSGPDRSQAPTPSTSALRSNGTNTVEAEAEGEQLPAYQAQATALPAGNASPTASSAQWGIDSKPGVILKTPPRRVTRASLVRSAVEETPVAPVQPTTTAAPVPASKRTTLAPAVQVGQSGSQSQFERACLAAESQSALPRRSKSTPCPGLVQVAAVNISHDGSSLFLSSELPERPQSTPRRPARIVARPLDRAQSQPQQIQTPVQVEQPAGQTRPQRAPARIIAASRHSNARSSARKQVKDDECDTTLVDPKKAGVHRQ